MKLSELIKQLQKLKKEHGDVDVYCDFITLSEGHVYYDEQWKVVEIESC